MGDYHNSIFFPDAQKTKYLGCPNSNQIRTKRPNEAFFLIFGQKELWCDLINHTRQREFGYYFDNSHGHIQGITKKFPLLSVSDEIWAITITAQP